MSDKKNFNVIDCAKAMKESSKLQKDARIAAYKNLHNVMAEMTEAGIPKSEQMDIITAMFKAGMSSQKQ